MIKNRVGEKPKPFCRTLIFVLDDSFSLRLNMESEVKKPLMWALSGSKMLSLLIPNV